MRLDPFDNDRPLTVQFVGVSLVAFLLTVLKPTALMILEHAMFAAELALAEGTISDDALRRIFTVFEGTADLLGSAATDRKGDMDGGIRRKRCQG